MKKCIGLTVAASLILFGLASNSFAQDNGKVVNLTPVVVTGAGASFSEKALNAFTKAYPNATNVKWFKADKNFLVTFTMDDEKNRALYDTKGYRIYAIRYGFEKDLAKSIRKSILIDYTDYDITAAVNVKQSNKDIWYVTLNGKKDFLMLAIEDDQITAGEPIKKYVNLEAAL